MPATPVSSTTYDCPYENNSMLPVCCHIIASVLPHYCQCFFALATHWRQTGNKLAIDWIWNERKLCKKALATHGNSNGNTLAARCQLEAGNTLAPIWQYIGFARRVNLVKRRWQQMAIAVATHWQYIASMLPVESWQHTGKCIGYGN